MTNKPGRGRPTKYSASVPKSLRKYTTECLLKGDFPTIEGFSAYLGVGTRTLYDWQLEYPDFSQTMNELRDTQKHHLISKGLTGGYNTRFAMFLLRANHGMSEKNALVEATQNNYMNISPELLADALEIMKEKEE
ncbi:hypothetical protein KBC89_00280 [Candidatus Woesebacteria bacterium]|nr:hypothetical protein [Candidatus Woesebacteria bacterium]